MVIHRFWFRKEVIFYERKQVTRNLGQTGGKMLLNSKKADARFSMLQAYYPEVNSEAKDMVNCRFTLRLRNN